MNVLVTGGAGYIGSHICVELIEAGHNVIVIDDFSNSKPEVLNYIKELTGKEVKFYEFNVLDKEKMEEVFSSNDIDSIIHCAAFKAVGESMIKPIEYYTNNLMSTLVVAKMMKKYNVNNIVFSSSATVYGDPEEVPLAYGGVSELLRRKLLEPHRRYTGIGSTDFWNHSINHGLVSVPTKPFFSY